MPKSSELDALKLKEQAAFEYKQAAFTKYKDARNRASDAYDVLQDAWFDYKNAREEMNREYETLQRSHEHYREIWSGYERVRDCNNPRIESLRNEADDEHAAMKTAFERAKAARRRGEREEASAYSAEGREHKARRDQLNTEIIALIQEIRNAKSDAESRAPRPDSSAFYQAREAFKIARSKRELAQIEFERIKIERDCYKSEFDTAQENHVNLKDEFQRKLAEMRSQRAKNPS